MISFMPRLHHPRERTPVSVGQEAGCLQSCAGHFGEERHLLLLLGFETQIIHSVAWSLYLAVQTVLQVVSHYITLNVYTYHRSNICPKTVEYETSHKYT